MSETTEATQTGSFRPPKLITTSVVRGSEQGESHGGVYLVDFAEQSVDQVVDWNTTEIDFTGRGWDRGLRGIAFYDDEVYIAASNELFVYDQHFRLQRSFRSTYLRHCHEICVMEDKLFLTSTGHDSILGFDLSKQAFFWALHIALTEDGPQGTPYDPNGINGPGGASGPPARNELHLNNVFVDDTGIYVSGMRTRGMLRVGSTNQLDWVVELPEGIHNARPFGDGVLFYDTANDFLRHVKRDGSERRFAVPTYDRNDLSYLDFEDGKIARQGFGRGLCVINERIVAGGSSPSTLSLHDLEAGETIASVNFSTDIRNAIHGLEVWPFD